MPRITKLDEPRRAKLISLLAEGEWLADALKAIGVSRSTLHRAETADEAFKRQVRAAVSGGIRFKIDEAMQRVLSADSRDSSIIARHIMEAAEKRARLLAPERFSAQTQATQALPGTSGMMMIRWQTDASADTNTNAQTIENQPHTPTAPQPARPAIARNPQKSADLGDDDASPDVAAGTAEAA